jgi:hypothetical protein
MAPRSPIPLLPLARAAIVLAVGALAFVAQASAAGGTPMLYKCVSAKGVTSIQSSACPAGATTAWKRAAPPEAPLTPAASAQAEAKRLHDLQTVRELSSQMERDRARELAAKQAAAVPRDEDDDPDLDTPAQPAAQAPPPPGDTQAPAVADPDLKACTDAQAFANAAREKEWLGLSEDQIRRLYGWVALQCKIPGA